MPRGDNEMHTKMISELNGAMAEVYGQGTFVHPQFISDPVRLNVSSPLKRMVNNLSAETRMNIMKLEEVLLAIGLKCFRCHSRCKDTSPGPAKFEEMLPRNMPPAWRPPPTTPPG